MANTAETIDELKDRLGSWTTTQHAIQFTLENGLPDDLIKALVRTHQREIDANRL